MRCRGIARVPPISATTVLCLLLVLVTLVDVVSFCPAAGSPTPNSAGAAERATIRGEARTRTAQQAQQAQQALQRRRGHLAPLPAMGTSTDDAASSAEVASTSTATTPAAAPAPTTAAPVAKTASSERFDNFAKFLLETQEVICQQAEASDGRGSFCFDRWERDGPSQVGTYATYHTYGTTLHAGILFILATALASINESPCWCMAEHQHQHDDEQQ